MGPSMKNVWEIAFLWFKMSCTVAQAVWCPFWSLHTLHILCDAAINAGSIFNLQEYQNDNEDDDNSSHEEYPSCPLPFLQRKVKRGSGCHSGGGVRSGR